jgi:dual specificity MAP kinase phosphatase
MLFVKYGPNDTFTLSLCATDSFAAFEARHPALVAVTSGGTASRSKVDFWEQEREQMALLTRASEIAPGIWVSSDCICMQRIV